MIDFAKAGGDFIIPETSIVIFGRASMIGRAQRHICGFGNLNRRGIQYVPDFAHFNTRRRSAYYHAAGAHEILDANGRWVITSVRRINIRM